MVSELRNVNAVRGRATATAPGFPRPAGQGGPPTRWQSGAADPAALLARETGHRGRRERPRALRGQVQELGPGRPCVHRATSRLHTRKPPTSLSRIPFPLVRLPARAAASSAAGCRENVRTCDVDDGEREGPIPGNEKALDRGSVVATCLGVADPSGTGSTKHAEAVSVGLSTRGGRWWGRRRKSSSGFPERTPRPWKVPQNCGPEGGRQV